MEFNNTLALVYILGTMILFFRCGVFSTYKVQFQILFALWLFIFLRHYTKFGQLFLLNEFGLTLQIWWSFFLIGLVKSWAEVLNRQMGDTGDHRQYLP